MTTRAMMTALIQRLWHRVIAASISFPMRCPSVGFGTASGCEQQRGWLRDL
jgi:hypothetical protein